MDLDVAGFEWDDSEGRNVDHIASHQVKPEDVEEVLSLAPRFALNKRDDGATHAVLGQSAAGRYLFVAMVETPRAGIWYVVTAHWMNRRRAERLYRAW